MLSITIGLLFSSIIELNSLPLKTNIPSDSLNVPQGVFQFMASLQLRHNHLHICGAALITSRNALSAAHCSDYKRYVSQLTDLDSENVTFGLAIGSHSINPGGEWHPVLYFICPKEYEDGRNPYSSHDITVIQFGGKIIMKTRIGHYLPHLTTGNRGAVPGWGLGRSSFGATAQKLRRISFHIVNDSFCEDAYNIKLKNQFCGQSNNEDESLVQGDDGGIFTPIEEWKLYAGVVSNIQYGSKFIVFTNVYKHMRFIMAAVVETFKVCKNSNARRFIELCNKNYPEYIQP